MPMDAYAIIPVLLALIAVLLCIIAGLSAENARLRKHIAPMDRDGDGRIGGSKKRAY